jgi:hypothetical protein
MLETEHDQWNRADGDASPCRLGEVLSLPLDHNADHPFAQPRPHQPKGMNV